MVVTIIINCFVFCDPKHSIFFIKHNTEKPTKQKE